MRWAGRCPYDGYPVIEEETAILTSFREVKKWEKTLYCTSPWHPRDKPLTEDVLLPLLMPKLGGDRQNNTA